jgi:hypothetical protein
MNDKKIRLCKSRKLVAGFGINDAGYTTAISESRKNESGKYVKKVLWTCPYFSRWTSMLHRAYNHLDRPTYEGCSVADDWLTFSNFKAWMENQYWEGLQLDKDILVEGNKVYSASTCAFVPNYLNVVVSIARMGSKYGPGVYVVGKKFVAKMTIEGSSVEIGRFKTQEEATNAYRAAKAEALEKALRRYKEESFFNKGVESAILMKIRNMRGDNV